MSSRECQSINETAGWQNKNQKEKLMKATLKEKEMNKEHLCSAFAKRVKTGL